ncbi:MAG: hypothetical protein WBH03_13405, partial [Cyclobacteriaceae bacterium]
MKSTKLTGWLLAGLTTCFGMVSCGDENVAPPEDPTITIDDNSFIPGQYIVVFNEETTPGSRQGEPDFVRRQDKTAYAAERRKV